MQQVEYNAVCQLLFLNEYLRVKNTVFNIIVVENSGDIEKFYLNKIRELTLTFFCLYDYLNKGVMA
jgi:hypothetical protein